MEPNKLIERFAEIQGITYEEAVNKIGGDNDDEILANIENFTKQQIILNSNLKLNRAQRRALKKKLGKQGNNEVEVISETAQKLNYIDLIQKLRELNKKKEIEKNETINENN